MRAVIALIFIVVGVLFSENAYSVERKAQIEPMTEAPATAQIVYLGIYLVNIHGIDMESSTFVASGYIWLRWKGDIDPTSSLEFSNSVEAWSRTREALTEQPTILPDGSKLMTMRFEGRFFRPMSLENYPLDRQSLSITFEDSLNEVPKLVLVPDMEQTGIGRQVQIPGWNIGTLTANRFIHKYGSNFGDVEVEADGYSAVEFSIDIERPQSFFVSKILLPLIIVVISAFVGLLLPTAMIDTRTYMPVTALLTAIFLQQSYTGNLPQVGTLVLADRIYLLAYILILLTTARMIAVSMMTEIADDRQLIEVKQTDRRLFFVMTAVFAVGVYVTIGFR